MNLSSLLIDVKEAWVDFPGLSGFSVNVNSLSRKELKALHTRCLVTKYENRQAVQILDEEKFNREFTKAAIKNWKGLKLSYLEDLMLVNIAGKDPKSELDYSEENAFTLVSNSTAFDQWLTEVVSDLNNFRSGTTGGNVEETGKVA